MRVAVLSDGKPGHVNQSLGVSDHLPDAETQVFTLDDGRRGKRLVREVLAALVRSPSLARRLAGWWAWPGLVAEAERFGPRVIISTGSAAAPVNLLLARALGARAVACMKPGAHLLGAFDLALVPAHDNPPPRPNILVTRGAPNRITPMRLASAADELAPQLRGEGPYLGVLIGGVNEFFDFSLARADRLIEGLLAMAEEGGYRLLVTTSRRTPEEVDRRFEEALAPHPRTAYLLIAGRSPENPVPGILAHASLVVVTEDSISMVSEAASTGRPVLVTELDRRGAGPVKHRRALENLEAEGAVRCIPAEDLAGALELARGARFTTLNDAAEAAARVAELCR